MSFSQLQFTVAKKRHFFGRQYNFSDYNSSTNRDNYVDIPSIPSPEDVVEIKRMELETGVQVKNAKCTNIKYLILTLNIVSNNTFVFNGLYVGYS